MSAFAMQVGWSGTGGAGSVTLADQVSAVPEGSLVALGLFPGLNDADIAALATPSAIWSAFSAWETAAFNADGLYDGAGQAINGTGYFSSQAYVVAFNAASAASATQWGVFKGVSVANDYSDAWIFPSADGNLTVPTMTIDGVPQAGVIIGSFGSLTYSPAWGQDTEVEGTEYYNAYALIPEPSTYMLVATGLMGLLALRRRS
jgi:hypothetical protein